MQNHQTGQGEKEKRTIKTHEDLVIYQKAFETAMIIFELSLAVPPRRKILSYRPLFDVLLAQSVPILRKHGVKEDIKPHYFFTSYRVASLLTVL